MKIRVRFFAGLRELAGHRQIELEVPPATTVASLRELVGDRFPGLKRAPAQVAVNAEFAPPEQVLQAGDEVALLPPMSGG
ncbi:MAG TPA: molybdopterin converting factor subunit 1 [Dehalococcoidia bacterium]|nr:molybdopterin converting factor subunit 1 [Dehalococcoidia bacterium]